MENQFEKEAKRCGHPISFENQDIYIFDILKFNQIKSKLGNLGENKLLLITSITLMDEYFETKKNIEIKKQEIDNLKIKFKELKSLVYGYKDQKDTEINELQKQQEKFKNELENLNNVYEKTIENASSQIEEFINKNNFS